MSFEYLQLLISICFSDKKFLFCVDSDAMPQTSQFFNASEIYREVSLNQGMHKTSPLHTSRALWGNETRRHHYSDDCKTNSKTAIPQCCIEISSTTYHVTSKDSKSHVQATPHRTATAKALNRLFTESPHSALNSQSTIISNTKHSAKYLMIQPI
jgi:hypothetical protein